METVIQVKKKEQWAILPIKEKHDSHGYSVYNLYTTVVPRGIPTRIPVGLNFQSKENFSVLVVGQPPSEWNRNLEVRGELLGVGRVLELTVVNHGDDDLEINPLTRISTITFLKASGGDPIIVDELDATVRGENGFGSTGL